MDFDISEERRILRDTAARFIQDRCPIETRHKVAASELGFSREMWDGSSILIKRNKGN